MPAQYMSGVRDFAAAGTILISRAGGCSPPLWPTAGRRQVYSVTVTSARHYDSEALSTMAMVLEQFGDGLELLVVRTSDVIVDLDVTCRQQWHCCPAGQRQAGLHDRATEHRQALEHRQDPIQALKPSSDKADFQGLPCPSGRALGRRRAGCPRGGRRAQPSVLVSGSGCRKWFFEPEASQVIALALR